MLTSAASRWLSGVGTFVTISATALASHSAITLADADAAGQARARPSSALGRSLDGTLGIEALGNADDRTEVMTSSWILMRHGPDRPPSWLPQGWIPNARNVLELAPGGNPVRAATIHFAPRT